MPTYRIIDPTHPEYGTLFTQEAETDDPRFELYVPPEPTLLELRQRIRGKRNALLARTDWTQLLDAPLTAEQKLAWQTYRQQLRDIIQTITRENPIPTWPTPPNNVDR